MSVILLTFYECGHCGVAIGCFFECEHEGHFCRERAKCEARAGSPRPDGEGK